MTDGEHHLRRQTIQNHVTRRRSRRPASSRCSKAVSPSSTSPSRRTSRSARRRAGESPTGRTWSWYTTTSPALTKRRKTLAGYCSGGELQMLVIGQGPHGSPQAAPAGRALLGLAPLVVREIFRIIKRINEEQGTTIVLVEQNANMALQIATRLRHGEWQDRHGGRGRGAEREPGRQGVLPGSRGWRSHPVVPGCEILQAAETMAVS